MLELRQSQRVHMPGLASTLDDIRNDDVSEDSVTGGSLKLWLPSQIPAEDRDAWCLPGIPSLEFRFRYAQADDSLAEIRRLRRLVQGLRDQNLKHPFTTQKSHSRAATIFEGFKTKIQRFAVRYSHARNAMLLLDPREQLIPRWGERFRKLNESDIRGPGREVSDSSEGQFKPSWIWLLPVLDRLPPILTPSNGPGTTSPTPESATTTSATDPPTATVAKPVTEISSETAANPVTGNSTETAPTTATGDSTKTATSTTAGDSTETATTATTSNPQEDVANVDSMRAHWAKCQARAERYEEEVILTIEEMGRTLLFLEWKRSKWTSLAYERLESKSPPATGVSRGLNAYTERQADVYETLGVSFVTRWRGTLTSHGKNPPWLSDYPPDADPLPSRPSRGHIRPKVTVIVDASTSDHTQTNSVPPPLPDEPTDAPLASEEENEEEADYDVGEPLDYDD